MKFTYLAFLLLFLGLDGCATKPPAAEEKPVADWQKDLEQEVRDRFPAEAK
jgi:hypothetical protein